MNQILQSDWFRERAEFSDLDRGQRNAPKFGKIKGFLLVKFGKIKGFLLVILLPVISEF